MSKKKDKWIKIGDGVYQKLRYSYKPKKKLKKKKKKKLYDPDLYQSSLEFGR
jgi:hypothetical protein